MVAHAYSLHDPVAHGEGDEVWECDDSDVESNNNSDSEQDSDGELPLPPSPVAAQVKHVLQYKGVTPHKMPAPPGVQVRTVQTPPKNSSSGGYPSAQPDVKVRSVESPSFSSNAATSLALHLRKDNERLRELLVEAQKQAEEALEQGDSKSNVDFAHLLDLVKEFGTGLGDCGETQQEENAEMCLSFNTQEYRMDADDVDEKDMEIKRLESELAQLKDQLKMQNSGIKPVCTTLDDEASMELVGYWVSSNSKELHHIVRADTDTDIDAPNATEWEIVEVDAESVTLRSDSGVEHTIERLKTRMFGESLLWGSGDLWTPQKA
eukprot:gnl/MRDRNA2_/MRDRNA2_90861_c0_seq1.p1 gnl/MRDRNA2_/MRDRNA2_90861_c0~~gnl/MRDRNA2_/MRDRNA2_90861_c0_seq1.p1  ORF type:complete len:352 (+),score=80.69 gnl/MRDRNA2_/MRDRNA2_90861_c0_seq1:95-1057(+)